MPADQALRETIEPEKARERGKLRPERAAELLTGKTIGGAAPGVPRRAGGALPTRLALENPSPQLPGITC
jgi:hypothetical protein